MATLPTPANMNAAQKIAWKGVQAALPTMTPAQVSAWQAAYALIPSTPAPAPSPTPILTPTPTTPTPPPNMTPEQQKAWDAAVALIPKTTPPIEPPPVVITPTDTTDTTDWSWLDSNLDFQKLPKDMQDYIKQYYSILKIQDTETQKKLTAALEEAKKQANPYWAEIMTVAQDELSRSLKTKSDDFATNEAYLQEQISRIKTDLATKKGDLTIDEQAELARQARSYEVSLGNLRESAAATGLTFSTKRAEAETRLSTEGQDIIESTKTKYMREGRDLETLAARGEADAISKLAEYKRILGEQQMSILRAAESKLGTAGLPTLPTLAPGVTPLGGVKGTVEEEKLKDIWTRAESLAGLGNPFL